MEVAGDGMGPFHLGPLTSTPIESSTPNLPTRADSLSSESSESSGEDWLIKVRCPGARHRYSKQAHAKKCISSRSTRTGISSVLDKEDDFTEKREWTPLAPYQDYSRVPKQDSADLQWLIRLRCPRAQMEQLMPDLKQSFPGVTRFLRSQSKVCGSSQSEKTKTSQSWLTQKHLSIAQALVNESQDVVGPIQFLLERENCFIREVDRYLKHSDFLALRRREMLYKKWFESVSRPLLQKIQDKVDNQSSKEIEERKRKQLSLYLNYCNEKGGAFLESYSPSSYDPFFLKTCSGIWKASVPPLHDPLLKEVQGRYIEAGIIEQCDTGKLYSSKEINELHKIELPRLPLSRQFMNPIEWLKIPFQYMESEVRQNSWKTQMRARKGKEEEKARKKEINLLARDSTTRKARNLLSNS
ncbi:protein FAM228B isoform X2 [Candoia aspera]|uniref:protein FAM228B isoform X2 n=1 Tax=Candoia aspera TaxID=51853 RepID=UPI002FD86598